MEKLKMPTASVSTTPTRASPAMNSSSSASEPASWGATARPRNSTSHVVAREQRSATTAHAASVAKNERMRAVTTRLALSPSARRGLHVLEQDERHRERPAGDGPHQQEHEPDDDERHDAGRGPELRRTLRKVVVDVVFAQQRHVDEPGREQKRHQARKDTQDHVRISRKTFSACAAPNRKALLALSVTPCASRRTRQPSGTPPPRR